MIAISESFIHYDKMGKERIFGHWNYISLV